MGDLRRLLEQAGGVGGTGHRDVPYWVWAYVEHNCLDYYLVGYGYLNISNLPACVRGEG